MYDLALRLKVEDKVKREFEILRRLRGRSASKQLTYEDGCFNCEILGFVFEFDQWGTILGLTINLSEGYSTNKVYIDGEDLVNKSLKIVKDRKYQTVALARI